MAKVFSLQFLSVKAVVKILLDHEEKHNLELQKKSRLVIKQLSTQCYTAVSLDILISFVDQHPRLLTGEILDALAAPHMTTLCLNQCSGIVGGQKGGLRYLENVMKRCRRLQQLEFNTGHSSEEATPEITTELCHIISANVNNLTSLSFESCKTLVNENVQVILKHCLNLSQLNVSMCPAITDQVFDIRSSHQTAIDLQKSGSSRPATAGSPGRCLTTVDVSCNQNLTSTCIRHLVSLCRGSLHSLNVSCTGIDCTSLWYLCGYSWYDAVQLASTLKNENTSEKILLSKLMKDYQTLNAELNRQISANMSEDELKSGIAMVGCEKDIDCRKSSEFREENQDDYEDKLEEESTFEKADRKVVPAVGGACSPSLYKCDQEDPFSNMEYDGVLKEEAKNLNVSTSQEESGSLQLDDVQLTFNDSYSSMQSCSEHSIDNQNEISKAQSSPNDSSKLGNVTSVKYDESHLQGLKTSPDVQLPVSNVPSQVVGANSKEDSSGTSVDFTCYQNLQSTSPLSVQHDNYLDTLVSDFVDGMLLDISRPFSETCTDVIEMSEQENSERRPSEELKHATGYDPSRSSEYRYKLLLCHWKRKFTPNIKALDLINIEFDDVLGEFCFQEFFKFNRGLQRLNLSWKEISDELISSVKDSLSDLRWLSLSECGKITSQGLADLLTVCKNLTYLNIEGMHFITDTALNPLFFQDERCGVRSLKLSETCITDISLDRIAKYLGSRLTVLHLNWCEEISDAGLATIAQHCHQLTDFAIRQCSTSRSTLLQLSDNCSDLISLNLSSVNILDVLVDDVLVSMTLQLSLLKMLDVSWNFEVTDVAVCSLFINCPLLDDVCLDGLKMITSKPFLPIIAELARWRRCQALIKLKLKERKLLKKIGESHFSSDEEYEDLFVPTRSTTYALHLRSLSLQYCDLVNDRHLAEIVAVSKGTLNIKDYYGEQIIPKLIDCR